MNALPRAKEIRALLLAAIAVAVASPPIHAQEATTPPAGAYQGWVHMVDDDGKSTSTTHWNTRNDAMASTSGSGDTLRATFRDPVKHESSDYSAATGIIRTIDLSPHETPGFYRHFPIAYAELLGDLQQALGKDNVKFSRQSEQGLDRYDFTLTFPPAKLFTAINARDKWLPLHTISSAWVDPKTGLLAKVTGGGTTVTLTYGAPEIQSIHDLGVPRDARVISNRPAAEAIAVYDRMEANLRRQIPDGILVTVLKTKNLGEITLYYQHGVHWARRNYRVSTPGPDAADGVDVPTDWQTAGADEFFRRLAITMPSFEASGDDNAGQEEEFDPKTGNTYISWGASWEDENGQMRSAEGKDPGPQKLEQSTVYVLHTLNGPTSWGFPREAVSGRYNLINHFEIGTSREHPGLIAVRTRYNNDPPTEQPRALMEAWIDPAHKDRAVMISRTSYQDPPGTGVRFKTVKEFSDYSQYPAPDNRYYPRLCKETDYDRDASGNLVLNGNDETTAQFFPNRALPDVPKNPATLPAAALHDMP